MQNSRAAAGAPIDCSYQSVVVQSTGEWTTIHGYTKNSLSWSFVAHEVIVADDEKGTKHNTYPWLQNPLVAFCGKPALPRVVRRDMS